MQPLKGLKRLIGLDTSPYLTVSLYLDVDGRKFPNREFEIRLKDLVRRQAAALAGQPDEVRTAAESDLRRVERYIVSEFIRGSSRMVAVFACEPAGVFEVFTGSFSLKSRLTLNHRPYITPLLTAWAGSPTALVVLSDRAMARYFLFESGRLAELGRLADEVPAQVRKSGWKGYSERNIERHIDEHVQWHLKNVAEECRHYYELYAPDVVILGGPGEILPDLERWLPATIQRKLGPTLGFHYESGHLKEIQDAVQRTLVSYEAEHQRRIVQQVLEKQPHGATTGVEPTLDALNAFRVATLVFDADINFQGYRCSDCGYLATNMDRCPRCQKPMELEPDLLPETLELAIQQAADLVPLHGTTDLTKRIRRVGALLRY